MDIFFKHGHAAYQIDGDDEQNRMQVKISSKGQTGDLGMVNRSYIIKFRLPCKFQRFFIPNFVCVLTNGRYKIDQTGFIFCRLGHAPGVGLSGRWRCPGVKFFQSWSCGISN